MQSSSKAEYRDESFEVPATTYQMNTRRGQNIFSSGIYDPVAGIPVNAKTAMTHSAVYRCVSLKAAALASCRAEVIRQDRKSGKFEVITDHPAHHILNRTPDFDAGLSPFTFFENLVTQEELLGNSYAQVEYNNRQQGTACIPLPNNWVTPEWDSNGKKIYKIHTDGYFSPKGRRRKADEVLQVDEVIHFADLLTDDGLKGISKIERMAQEVSLGLASTRHSARYFKHGRPLGFVSVKEYLKAKDKTEMQEEWETMHKTPWSVGVLANEAKWIPLSLSAQEVQLIETREFQIADIARFYGVPSFLLGLANKEGYKSAEQLFRAFVTSTLGPLVMKLEQELRLKLFTRDESFNYFIRFNMDDMQRGDTEAMSKIIESQIRHGLLMPNEYRRSNFRPDVEFGDVPLAMASQLAPLEDVVKGTANLGKGTGSSPQSGSGSSGSSKDTSLVLSQTDRLETARTLIDFAKRLLAEQAL